MATPPSLPPAAPEVAPPGLTAPETGAPVPVADLRAEFERLSRQVPRDPEAERAFLEGKIELIRNDPRLSPAEKERAIAALRLGRAGEAER